MNKPTCAICGKQTTCSEICNNCFKNYFPNGTKPEWVKALIQIERRQYNLFERRPREIVFSELGESTVENYTKG